MIPKLCGMLVMGVATVAAVCYLQPGYAIWDSFLNTPLLGKTGAPDTGLNADLVLLSLSYAPLMILTTFLRDAGVGKGPLMMLKTPYVLCHMQYIYSFAQLYIHLFYHLRCHPPGLRVCL